MNNIGFDNNNDNIYDDIDMANQNYQNENEEIENNDNEGEEDEDEDDRLTYTLITLDLGNLIHIFEENNISFIDMLLLTKEDLKDLQLSLYQRNRIYNFSLLFSKYAKNYSISEISDFFSFNKQFIFNSSIYDRVNMAQNNLPNDNNNYYEDIGNEDNYNFNESQFENKNSNINNDINSKYNTQTYSNGGVNNNYDYNLYNQNAIKNEKKNKKQNNNITNSFNSNLNSNKINNNINNNNDKKQIKKNNMNNNLNNNENFQKYFIINNNNKKANLAVNNYLSIKKDTDDFLTKLNKQKEQSELKRGKVSSLINKQKNNQSYQYKMSSNQNSNDLLINNQEKNIIKNEEDKQQRNKKRKEKKDVNTNKDINEQYQKMINQIDEIEQMKMDYNSYTHLNQIKNYINNKGENIKIEDINRINGEIGKMIQILIEKEKLKKALENCNLKIKQNKEMINNIEKIEGNIDENMANVLKNVNKEKEQKYIQKENNEYNNNENENFNEIEKDNKNDVDEVVEVEEEYFNENDNDNDNDNNNEKNI